MVYYDTGEQRGSISYGSPVSLTPPAPVTQTDLCSTSETGCVYVEPESETAQRVVDAPKPTEPRIESESPLDEEVFTQQSVAESNDESPLPSDRSNEATHTSGGGVETVGQAAWAAASTVGRFVEGIAKLTTVYGLPSTMRRISQGVSEAREANSAFERADAIVRINPIVESSHRITTQIGSPSRPDYRELHGAEANPVVLGRGILYNETPDAPTLNRFMVESLTQTYLNALTTALGGVSGSSIPSRSANRARRRSSATRNTSGIVSGQRVQAGPNAGRFQVRKRMRPRSRALGRDVGDWRAERFRRRPPRAVKRPRRTIDQAEVQGPTLVGRSRYETRSRALRILRNDPDHILRPLLTKDGTRFRPSPSRRHSDLAQDPYAVQMGHMRSNKLSWFDPEIYFRTPNSGSRLTSRVGCILYATQLPAWNNRTIRDRQEWR